MKDKKFKGFTLIEVAIVLAIAALIILVVFAAVSSAQKSQRDTARKNQAGQLSAMMESYASNHSGVYPDEPADGSDFTASLGSYEASTYPITGKYIQQANCSAMAKDKYFVIYDKLSGGHSYTLKVCLESGGSVEITQ